MIDFWYQFLDVATTIVLYEAFLYLGKKLFKGVIEFRKQENQETMGRFRKIMELEDTINKQLEEMPLVFARLRREIDIYIRLCELETQDPKNRN